MMSPTYRSWLNWLVGWTEETSSWQRDEMLIGLIMAIIVQRERGFGQELIGGNNNDTVVALEDCVFKLTNLNYPQQEAIDNDNK